MLAFGLAMDATAMAAVRGLGGRRREAVLLPILFGVFQGGMAALGWLLGAWGGEYVVAWDHWIASGLLFVLGGKMFLEAWRSDAEEPTEDASLVMMLGLAVATSIDAAAAGLTLPLLDVTPVVSLTLITVITFACSVVGFAAGKRASSRLGSKLEAVGGVLLVGIGIRILVQHL